MLEQDILYGGGIDVMAAADHEVLGAPGDPEQTVFVETAKIAGIDPVAVNESAFVVLLVKIAAEDSRSRHDDDSDLVYRTVTLEPAVVVELDDTNPRVRHRPAYRTEADQTIRIGHGVYARSLGHAVDLENWQSKLVLDRLANGYGNCRSASGRVSQARYVGIARRHVCRCR